MARFLLEVKLGFPDTQGTPGITDFPVTVDFQDQASRGIQVTADIPERRATRAMMVIPAIPVTAGIPVIARQADFLEHPGSAGTVRIQEPVGILDTPVNMDSQVRVGIPDITETPEIQVLAGTLASAASLEELGFPDIRGHRASADTVGRVSQDIAEIQHQGIPVSPEPAGILRSVVFQDSPDTPVTAPRLAEVAFPGSPE